MSATKLIVIIVGAFIVLFLLGWVAWAINGCGQVVKNELDPVVLQQKYEWFKDCAAALDAKQADIKVMEMRVKVAKGSSKEIAYSELAAVVMSYNALAADYNSQMAKWNWRFCNRGELPAGATEVLPREFRTYETTLGE